MKTRVARGQEHAHGRRCEQGVALIITVLMLSLVGAIAIAAIEHSGEELASGGRTRASTRTLHAANAGIEFALNRLAQSPPNTDAFDITLPNGVNVQSRSRDDAGPQPIVSVASELFLVNVTATAPDGSTAEIEIKAGAGSGGVDSVAVSSGY